MDDTYGRSPGSTNVADAEVLQNAKRTTMTWAQQKRARDAYATDDADRYTFQPTAYRGALGTLAGLKVLTLPETLKRRRTLWGAIKAAWRGEADIWEAAVPNPYLPEPGSFYRLGDTLYCRAEDHLTLWEAARGRPEGGGPPCSRP